MVGGSVSVPSRWQSHQDAAVTKQAIDLVLRLHPRTGVFENVMGLGHKQEQHDMSPLEAIMSRLRDNGYECDVVEVCCSTCMAVVRRRPGLQKKRQKSAKQR